MNQLLYVYGIIPSQQSIAELATITFGSLAAVVEYVSAREFGQEVLAENIKDMKWVSVKAVRHQEVLSSVGKEITVIPLKFGSVFVSEESVQAMLNEKSEAFSTILDRLDDKQEWGLKLFYQTATLQNWLEQNNKELIEIDGQISTLSSGAAFLLKKKKEQLLKNKVKAEINAYRKSIFELAKHYSEELLQNKELDSKLSGNPDANLLNLAILIRPGQLAALQKELIAIDESHKSRGLYHDLTGPWPAYNFVDL